MKRVWIVGAGVVGEATGKGLIKNGHDVTFIDKIPDVVRRLSCAGFKSVSFEEVEQNNPELPDVIMFCVQTPLKIDASVNLDYLTKGIETYSKYLKKILQVSIM